MKNRFDKCGSDWAKWDLHVHTPCSIVQEYGGDTDAAWEKFITDLENLPHEFKVIGINDYLFVDGYKKVLQYKEKGRLANIDTFLPVLEFRLTNILGVKGFKDFQRINFHIIFSEKIAIKQIEDFITSIKIDDKNYEIYENLSIASLTKYGKLITMPNKQASDIKIGFNNFSVDKKSIIADLEQRFKGKYITAIGLVEWKDMSWDETNIAIKQELINTADFIFSGSHSVEEFRKNEGVLRQKNVNDLLLHSSDAHCFSHNEKDKNRIIGRCYTWIKAEPTFEGLKMVLHERNRLCISETKPYPPSYTISSIEINLPETVEIESNGNKSLFCFRGTHEIKFSPYFNCIIGGRGSGKSSLLNLLDMVNNGTSKFFKLQNQGKDIINDIIKNNNRSQFPYVGITGVRDIEFITQNEIESIANNPKELTPFIYKRLLQKDEVMFKEMPLLENQLNAHKTEIEACKNLIYQLQAKEKVRSEKLRQKNDYQALLDSFDNESFTLISREIDVQKTQYQSLIDAKERLTTFKNQLTQLLGQSQIEVPIYFYDKAINQIISQIYEITQQINETDADNEIETLEQSIKIGEKKIADYLTKVGLSPEDKNEYNSAQTQIPKLANEITTLDDELAKITVKIEDIENKKENFIDTRTKIENLINQAIIPLNEELNIQNDNVKNIYFSYEFDDTAAEEDIYQKFRGIFSTELKRQSEDSIRATLFCINPMDIGNKTLLDFQNEINAIKPTTAKTIIQDIFKSEYNFKIYQLLVLERKIDVSSYKKIIGFYNSKPLQNCSFGQKCTAVIVALLMFGNKPLVIDEPEAHLDSKLIAEYLVTLIKEGKHRRQLIIATHNANFVINGDAEIVHCLSIDETDKTTILQTTIEDVSNRDRLLALEGGAEAFRKREKKLLNKSHH